MEITEAQAAYVAALFRVWREDIDRVPFAYESFWSALPAVDARMAEAARQS